MRVSRGLPSAIDVGRNWFLDPGIPRDHAAWNFSKAFGCSGSFEKNGVISFGLSCSVGCLGRVKREVGRCQVTVGVARTSLTGGYNVSSDARIVVRGNDCGEHFEGLFIPGQLFGVRVWNLFCRFRRFSHRGSIPIFQRLWLALARICIGVV